MSNMEWVKLDTEDIGEPAEVLQSLLQAHGIDAVLSEAGLHTTIPVTFGPQGRVDLLVPAAQLPQAQEVLREIRAGHFAAIDPLTDEDTPPASP